MGGSETSEEGVGMVQRGVLEPELGQEQQPGAYSRGRPEPPRGSRVDRYGLRSKATPFVGEGSTNFTGQVGVRSGRPQCGLRSGLPQPPASLIPAS